MFVLTLDQRRSRRRLDEVPQLLRRLNAHSHAGLVLAFERTTGDEIQGTVSSPSLVVEAAVAAIRSDSWRVGIGIGDVEKPLPSSTREARGPAYIAARAAVEAAHASPQPVRIVGAPGYGGRNMETIEQAVDRAESAMWLLASLLSRRTTDGWQVCDLLATGSTQRAIASRLRISPSAVSQRAARAGWLEESRGRPLIAGLLQDAESHDSSAAPNEHSRLLDE